MVKQRPETQEGADLWTVNVITYCDVVVSVDMQSDSCDTYYEESFWLAIDPNVSFEVVRQVHYLLQ